MRPSNRRGMTLIELVVSITIMATIVLAIVTMFKMAVMATIRSTSKTAFLTNVVEALQGNGPTRGMLFDVLYASATTTTSSATLTLSDPGAMNSDYALSASNLRRSSGTATLTTSALATGLQNLHFTYYQYYSTGSISLAGSAANANLITVSFQTNLTPYTTFYTGAVLRNHL